MLSSFEFPFSTLVQACASCLTALAFVATANGAVDAPSPDFEQDPASPSTHTSTQTIDTILKADTVDIAEPLPLPPRQPVAREYYYPYRSAITTRFGELSSSTTTNGTNTPVFGGIQYQFTKYSLQTYEIGADLIGNGTGDLLASRRWNFTKSRMRPYGKAGIGLLVQPQNGLANFVDFVNFQIEGAFGAEYSMHRSQSIRIELEFTMSSNSMQTVGAVGYVWAW